MFKLLKALLILFATGFSYLPAFCLAQEVEQTEKIKIVSACCLDGKWVFNLFDGSKGRTMPKMRIGLRNAEGFLIESFDEKMQIAIVDSPNGRFEVTMQIHESGGKKSAVTIAPTSNENTKVSRRNILNSIR